MMKMFYEIIKLKRLTASLLILVVLISFASISVAATEEDANYSKVIVSMGDSYSSGEGIDDFFDSELPLNKKISSQDWLAHRSKNAWSGMLTLPSVSGTMSEHRDENWYFVAASGAETEHIMNEQKKHYKKSYTLSASGLIKYTLEDDEYLLPQINVFEKLKKDGKQADYVTLTLGGNDADFVGVITDVVLGVNYFDKSALAHKINNIWKEYYKSGGIRDNLKAAYGSISEKAGQAHIIVAGYPKLFTKDGKGAVVSKDEATLVNTAVSNFNHEIEYLVNQCNTSGMNISFVSVEGEFDGCEAYSNNAWINNFEWLIKPQDISEVDITRGVYISAYSMHPNYKGAYYGYRKCVQDKIDELEGKKSTERATYNASDDEVHINNNPNNTNGYSFNERDVVLVLDSSGSMDGTPLDETKKAATKFVDTVLEQSASVGVVKYDDEAEIVSPFSNSADYLKRSITAIDTGGATNIEDGLSVAESMLSGSSAKKKIIVLMSDGSPNEGKVGDELIEYADKLKKQGIYIYTLGFFEELGFDKSSAQHLMEQIASEGCHYEVSDSDSLVYFFGDIADQINGQKYIYVRIACPVDVSVEYNGEILDSSDILLNTRTSFGTLTFEETDTQSYDSDYEYYDEADTDRVKILRLKEGKDYDILIEGTGRGRMNYSIGFMNDEGEYSDFRKFNNIKITNRTKIDTVAEVSDKTVLNVDEDGDGEYDLSYEAGVNERGKLVEPSVLVYVIFILLVVLVLLILILIIYLVVRKRKKIRY